MTGKERFLNTILGKETDSTPVWLMRQAGRYLPEYRELRQKYGFKDLVKTPSLALEVTLQPLRRFDLDAAILFSDILVVPEAMGQEYYFKETKGIGMKYALTSGQCVQQLNEHKVRTNLNYVFESLQLIKKELENKHALLGFGGSPWTLAAYMVEGESSSQFLKLKNLSKNHPKDFELLMQKLSNALIEYFKMQIEAGVDAIQIFDSWGNLCENKIEYWENSLKWIQYIIEALPNNTPIILFSKGMGKYFEDLLKTKAHGFSLGAQDDLKLIRNTFNGSYFLQGNIDPLYMTGPRSQLQLITRKLLEDMSPFGKFILNLGHGMTPDAKIENVTALIHTVRSFSR